MGACILQHTPTLKHCILDRTFFNALLGLWSKTSAESPAPPAIKAGSLVCKQTQNTGCLKSKCWYHHCGWRLNFGSVARCESLGLVMNPILLGLMKEVQVAPGRQWPLAFSESKYLLEEGIPTLNLRIILSKINHIMSSESKVSTPTRKQPTRSESHQLHTQNKRFRMLRTLDVKMIWLRI